MISNNRQKMFVSIALIMAILFSSFASINIQTAQAQSAQASVRLAQVMESEQTGLKNPGGLAFSSKSQSFQVVEALGVGDQTDIARLTPFARFAGSSRITAGMKDAINMTYDGFAQRLLLLQAADTHLVAVREAQDGSLDAATLARYNVRALQLQQPQGLAVDPNSGVLYILDAAGPRIVRVTPTGDGSFENASTSVIDLSASGITRARGLAFHPVTGYLFVVSVETQQLYELNASGAVVSTYDLSQFNLSDSQAIVLAPSGDQTDDASVLSLFVADSGGPAQKVSGAVSGGKIMAKPAAQTSTTGQIVELALVAPAEAGTISFISTVIRTVLTSSYDKPSPDPSGLAYLPNTNTLIMTDGEVEETVSGITFFEGADVWELTLSGSVVRTTNVSKVAPTLVPMTNEPTSIAWNPNNNHYYIPDDDARRVYDLNPGADGLPGTSDDTFTFFDTLAYGDGDPEGITYDTWSNTLFVADGLNAEVYRYTLTGALLSQFDVTVYGVIDPESIEFNAATGTLYILSNVNNPIIIETTTSGALLQTISFSSAGAKAPAGLAYAPASSGSGAKSFYIVDRGVDNNSNPTANDGKFFEMTAPSSTNPGNQPPLVNAGTDQMVTLAAGAVLDGTVTDDGNPNPPAAVTTAWSKISGPGTVTFGNSAAVDTTASFSAAGTYTLRLSASDGEFNISDDIVITVAAPNPGGTTTVSVKVMAAADDAEEFSSGSVDLGSTDIELVNDGSDQKVGLRFNGLSIPQGAIIINATVQFKVDETGSTATNLAIQAQAVDNAPAFTATSLNISSRAKTGASVAWQPAAWPTIGLAGADQRTPNIAPVIQEVVSRPGWTGGNSLVIVITGTGRRTAESYEGDAAGAALLTVEYSTTPVNSAPNVTISAPANGASFVQSSTIAFTGTATDTQDGNLTSSLNWTSSLDGAIGTGGSFSTSSLSVGNHTITASVTDSGGLTGSAQITLTITAPVNNLPTVSISAPVNGSSVLHGSQVAFLGAASDVEDGDLTTYIQWISNLNGVIGTGGSFSLSSLSVGVHTITASVTDSGGQTGSAQVSLTITVPGNDIPVVSITSPVNGASYTQGDVVQFLGSASDTEDGDLTSYIQWNLNGLIVTGGSFSLSSLPVGVHAITASVADSNGQTGQAQVTLTVNEPNTPPSVSITSPANASTFTQGDSINFTGAASDTHDGNVSSTIQWASNLDGNLGTGASITLTTLSVGDHTITAAVTDSGGLQASAQITLTIQRANAAPVVTITSPANNASFVQNASIAFSGTANDTEDGSIAASLVWTSSRDGQIGTGASFAITTLTVGVHTITAAATDSGGKTGQAQVTVTITAPVTDGIFANSFENGFTGWSSSATDNGSLSVTAAAAMVGSMGMQAVINDNNKIYVTDTTPTAEARYRVRFYFDLNSIVMANGNDHYILYGLNSAGAVVLRLQFRYGSSGYMIRVSALNDSSSYINTNWYAITDAPHYLEIDWSAATAAGANNGVVTLWIDGVQKTTVTNIDNDTRRIDTVQLGAVSGMDTGTRGTYYFDAFESRRQTYIGQ